MAEYEGWVGKPRREPPEETPASHQFCQDCGKAISPDATYCPQCGRKIDDTNPHRSAEEHEAQQTRVCAMTDKNDGDYRKTQQAVTLGVVRGIMAVVLLLLFVLSLIKLNNIL